MKSFLRSLVFVITLISIFVGLGILAIEDDIAMRAMSILGAFVVAAMITGLLAWFASWLAQPDEPEDEDVDGNDCSDEKAGRDMDTNSGIDFHS